MNRRYFIFFIFALYLQFNCIYTQAEIFCNRIQISDEQISFDCSNKSLTWANVTQIAQNVVDGGKSVDFSYNQLKDDYNNELKEYKILSEFLNLSNNQIENIDNLRLNILILDLSSNKINSIHSILQNLLMPNLTKLYLNENEINVINYTDTAIYSLNNLKSLYLSKCNIEYIQLDFFNNNNFPQLKYIDLSYNAIKQLKPYDQNFNLGFLNLIGNPLGCDCNLLWYKHYLSLADHTREFKDNVNKYPLMCHSNDLNRTVNVSYENDSLLRCHIVVTMKPADDKLKNNDKQILECVTTAYPEVNVWWMFGDKALNKIKDKDEKYIILTEQKQSSNMFTKISKLTIQNPNTKDSGNYKCFVSYINNQGVSYLNYTDFVQYIIEFDNIALDTDDTDKNVIDQIAALNKAPQKNEQSSFFLIQFIETIQNNHVYLLLFILFLVLLLISIILLVCMCILMCKRSRRDKDGFRMNENDALTANYELSIDEYERLNQTKIREHVDSTQYYPTNPRSHYTSHHYYADYLNESRDEGALSSVHSLNQTADTTSSCEENLDDYNDPLLQVNIRKPNQTISPVV